MQIKLLKQEERNDKTLKEKKKYKISNNRKTSQGNKEA